MRGPRRGKHREQSLLRFDLARLGQIVDRAGVIALARTRTATVDQRRDIARLDIERPDWIVTNPPFGALSARFMVRAIEMARLGVAMFVRARRRPAATMISTCVLIFFGLVGMIFWLGGLAEKSVYDDTTATDSGH